MWHSVIAMLRVVIVHVLAPLKLQRTNFIPDLDLLKFARAGERIGDLSDFIFVYFLFILPLSCSGFPDLEFLEFFDRMQFGLFCSSHGPVI